MTTAVQARTARPVREKRSTRPTRAEVIAAICETTGKSEEAAQAFLSWVQHVVGHARKFGYTDHLLTTRELKRYHKILNAIAPDRKTARPGSAHDLLERYVLDSAKGELALFHDKKRVFDHVYCTVAVQFMRVTMS